MFVYHYNSSAKYYLVTRIFNITEYSLLAWFFSLNLKNKIFSKFLLLSVIPYFLFCLLDFYTAKTPSIPFFPLVVQCILFLGIIIFLFFEKIQDDEVLIPLYETTIFWIATAFILYFAGNFFLFMYAKMAIKDEIFQKNYAIIYNAITIPKNILLCIGISIKERKLSHYTDNDDEDGIPLSKKNLDFLDFDNDKASSMQ